MSRVEEIRAREQAATAGPWTADSTIYHGIHENIVVAKNGDWVINKKQNCEFIAHSRQDIPYLLSELDQKAKELARLAIESVNREKQLAKLEAEVQHWADAEKDGRLVVLPHNIDGLRDSINDLRLSIKIRKEAEQAKAGREDKHD